MLLVKLVTAIINKKDVKEVCKELTLSRYQFTKMASTGGFLSTGNITIIMGVEDDRLEDALAIIRNHSSQRVEKVAAISSVELPSPMSYPLDVVVGGATVFVTNVEYFEKM